jgi:uncharacterized protein YciI
MWYLVVSRAIGPEEQRLANHEPHLEWLLEQHRAGRALFSGPTSDRVYGIYVLLAPSLEEARKLAAEDPHHLQGDREMEVFEWEPRRAMRLDGPTIADLEAMATTEGGGSARSA